MTTANVLSVVGDVGRNRRLRRWTCGTRRLILTEMRTTTVAHSCTTTLVRIS